jgi:prevent-host-death family protein
MQEWKMQDAKARLPDVIRCAKALGPQNITLHGLTVAVVLSQAMYEKLTCNQQSLVSFMHASPLHAIEDVPFERDKSPTRKLSL